MHTYTAFHNYGYHYYPAYRAHPVYHYGYGYRPFYGFYPYSYGYGVYPYSWSYPPVGGYLTTDPAVGSVPATDPPAANGTDPGGTQNPPPAAAPVSAGADTTRTAHITVNLPADAVLWFDGIQMTATGTVREFNTPPVAAGQHYAYQVHAVWMLDNRPMDQTQQVEFTAGDRIAVTLPMAIP
ncbi:TIGR03000 domain-containing protein [bacterium]|nr:TIGR03000 domain-containing protein [bacterium]